MVIKTSGALTTVPATGINAFYTYIIDIEFPERWLSVLDKAKADLESIEPGSEREPVSRTQGLVTAFERCFFCVAKTALL